MKPEEKAAPVQGAAIERIINALNITTCKCSKASRRDFFAGFALAGIIASAESRKEVFHKCVADDLGTVQQAFRIGRTMASRADMEDGLR